MRDSMSDLAQAVKLWMTGTRDVEDQERIRAEADRRYNLAEEADKEKMYALTSAQSGSDLGEDDDDDDDEDDDDLDITSDEDGTLAHDNTALLRVRRPNDSDEDSDEDTDPDMLVGDVDSSGNEMSEEERGERLAEVLAGRELERIQGFRR